MQTTNHLPEKMASPRARRDGSCPQSYQITIQGPLALDWAEWFECMTIHQNQEGDTLLTGPVPDQAALHGLLARVRDLGLVLISIQRLETSG
jgi:hypothetical protein